MDIDAILTQSRAIRAQCFADPDLSCYIDMDLDIPRPYIEGNDIRLIVIGQDPTVQDVKSRRTIKTVLQLDKQNGQLFKYIERICNSLEFDILKNVYATNLWKCFYIAPPNSIKASNSIDILTKSLDLWLPLLKEELAHFPNAKIITLGEPVLQRLIHSYVNYKKLQQYWGYNRNWKTGFKPMFHVTVENSRIEREFFPFIHQPSTRSEFYQQCFPVYSEYVRSR